MLSDDHLIEYFEEAQENRKRKTHEMTLMGAYQGNHSSERATNLLINAVSPTSESAAEKGRRDDEISTCVSLVSLL
jgi:predicted MarR family transcription regulator